MDIVLYMHVHQPFRVREYTIFDAGVTSDYFDAHEGDPAHNLDILNKVSEKSYLPTNKALIELLHKHPEFRLSISITGTLLEQLETYRPDVLRSFQVLIATGRVEIVGETYHHSLAFFYDRLEFERQVVMHKDICERLFNYVPQTFRNTELSYNNELGKWANERGYRAVLTEGWDPVLGWQSPDYVYTPKDTDGSTKLLMKNYRLSDDIAFRFGNPEWSEWPLTADKYTHWIREGRSGADIVNLFMDYETFGEHVWEESGIYDFLHHLPKEWLGGGEEYGFKTISEAAEHYESKNEIDVPHTITWADTERDLSAWVGNPMQQEAIRLLYDLTDPVLHSHDQALIADWRKLQTSDHFYYMCTKWWSDGDIHAYFSPYGSPYQAQMNFMNAVLDMRSRLAQKGLL